MKEMYACDKYATDMVCWQALSRKIVSLEKGICVTLPCLDKFCGLNRASLEGEQRMCCYIMEGPEQWTQPSLSPLHLPLSLQGIPKCPSTFPVTRSKHSKARAQCWCPTPHLCSIFHEYTCVSKHSVLTCHWHSSHRTEGSNGLTTPKSSNMSVLDK